MRLKASMCAACAGPLCASTMRCFCMRGSAVHPALAAAAALAFLAILRLLPAVFGLAFEAASVSMPSAVLAVVCFFV